MKRGVFSSTRTQSDPSLAALAVWVGGLKVRVGGEREGVLLFSMDEHLPNWVVESVQSGWTPREVLSWFFLSFKGLFSEFVTYVPVSD